MSMMSYFKNTYFSIITNSFIDPTAAGMHVSPAIPTNIRVNLFVNLSRF